MTSRPNILLIITDQQRFDQLGVKGLNAIPTPHLDRMAREGVHFDRAYTPSPTCTPARVSLITGQYPSRHGAWSLGISVDQLACPTIAQQLKDAGYHTSLFGKTHFVCRQDEGSHLAGGCDQPKPDIDFYRNFTGPYLGFDYVQVGTGHTINKYPDMHYHVFLEDAGVDYKAWFPLFGPEYDHDSCGPWDIPVEYHDTTWVSNNAIKWIHDHADTQNNEPWFCMAAFEDPHEPLVCPRPWYDKVDRSQCVPFEGPRDGEFDDKPEFYGKAAKGDWSELDDGHGVPSSYYTPKKDERAINALQATLGMVGLIDDRVGAMIQALEETGQADNTLVIFTSDHGELHGHHGFWGKGLTAYEDCQRIPMLIWEPSLVKAVGTTDALASLIDLPRTILEYAGVAIPNGMQGTDLSPILKGDAKTIQDHTLIECRATDKIYQQTFITDQYKLIVYEAMNDGELYDLHNDPDQYINLWADPAFTELKTTLLHRMLQAQMANEGTRLQRKAFA